MRVIFEADALRHPVTGIGRYVQSLGAALAAHPDMELAMMRLGRLQDADVETFHQPLAGVSGKGWARLRALVARQPLLARAVRHLVARRMTGLLRREGQRAVLHATNCMLPPHVGPRVVTVHDLSVFDWSACHPQARVVAYQQAIRESVACADMIIANTEFNRAELVARFDLPPDRVAAIPLACAVVFRPRPLEELAAVLSAHGLLPGRYGLFVGTVEPRKNLKTLLLAWRCLPLPLRQQYPLVIAGGAGWRSAEEHELMRVGEQEGWLRYLGYLPECDLPVLYAGARLFCFPSHYEGFGLPVLEAMASGVAVLSSNAACMPEVGGPACRYVAPDDADAWQAAIAELLESDVLCRQLGDAGLLRSRQFSWQRVAEQTAAVYRQAVVHHADAASALR